MKIVFILLLLPAISIGQTMGDSVTLMRKTGNIVTYLAPQVIYAAGQPTDDIITRNPGTRKRALLSPLLLPVSNATQAALDLKANVASQAVSNSAVAGQSSGTAYRLTTTSARLNFGTTSPTLTLPSSGTYLITYNASTDYNGATIALSRNIIYKVRRTNNTATDVHTMAALKTPVITALTLSAPQRSGQFLYTGTAGDVLEVWGTINVDATLGTVTAAESSIIAVKLF